MGASSGGPYVVACAALLPERIAGAGVVAGVTDMGWPGAWEGYEVREATLMRLGDEAAAVRWCEEHFGADGSRFLETFGEMAPADMALLEDEAIATGFITTIGEAFRQGFGGIRSRRYRAGETLAVRSLRDYCADAGSSRPGGHIAPDRARPPYRGRHSGRLPRGIPRSWPPQHLHRNPAALS